MKKLMKRLEKHQKQIRKIVQGLEGEKWPEEVQDIARYNTITYLRMAEGSLVVARTALEVYGQVAEERKEVEKEEESGEDHGLEVQEPESGSAGGEVPIQEPGPEGSEGD